MVKLLARFYTSCMVHLISKTTFSLRLLSWHNCIDFTKFDQLNF